MIFVKVELPGDNWAELKGPDELNTGDKLAVKRAMRVPMSQATGTVAEISGAFTDEMRITMMTRVIKEWSYEGLPIPSLAMAPEISIEQLPIKAYDALCDAIKPHMEAIEYSPS